MVDRRAVMVSLGVALAAGSHSRVQGRTPGGERIAILGTGHLGQTLGKGWLRTGHRIVFGSRTPTEQKVQQVVQEVGPAVNVVTNAEAAAQADLVVFAVPSKALQELLPSLGDLSGKVLVDPMNQMQIVAGYPMAPQDPVSTAERLQEWAPGAKVVKAFNTPGVPTIRDPRLAGGHVSIPLAGTDVAAKTRVAALATALGLEPVDTGPLVAARSLEALMRLSFGYYLYMKGKASFEYHLSAVSHFGERRVFR